MGKSSDKPKLKDMLLNIWPGLFKTVKVIKNKNKNVENYYTPDEAKEMTIKYNVVF